MISPAQIAERTAKSTATIALSELAVALTYEEQAWIEDAIYRALNSAVVRRDAMTKAIAK